MKENTILIVDDSEINRELLKEIVSQSLPQYKIIEAEDGNKAIEAIDAYGTKIAIILSDIVMPNSDGFALLNHLNKIGLIKIIPTIMISASSEDDNFVKAYQLGATDFISKPFNAGVVVARIKNILELFKTRHHMERELNKRTAELRASQAENDRNNEFIIEALSSVVEFRSLESGEHIQRVKELTGILLETLVNNYEQYAYLRSEIQFIKTASALHDIGKVCIPDSILLKPGRLTPEEFDVIKTHTTEGSALLERFHHTENDHFFRYSYDIARWHHERYDGRGYPDHLKGDDIPIWAQVVSIVDVFDALVSPRCYKRSFSVKEAVEMINRGECGCFSPIILDCCGKANEKMVSYLSECLEIKME